jgi:hypothetical protein
MRSRSRRLTRSMTSGRLQAKSARASTSPREFSRFAISGQLLPLIALAVLSSPEVLPLLSNPARS